MQIKGVLFDKDGTLIDFDAVWLTAAREVVPLLLQINHLPNDSEMQQCIYHAMGIRQGRVVPDGPLACMTYQEIAGEICRALRQKNSMAEESLVSAQLSVLFESICARNDFSYPALADLPLLFDSLSALGCKIGLATADTRTAVQRCFSALQVMERFDYIGCDDGKLRPKPEGDLFFAFAAACDLQPSEIMVVGDTGNDMLFAHRCGGVGAGVLSGVSKREDFGTEADFLLDSVADLPKLLKREQQERGGKENGEY